MVYFCYIHFSILYPLHCRDIGRGNTYLHRTGYDANNVGEHFNAYGLSFTQLPQLPANDMREKERASVVTKFIKLKRPLQSSTNRTTQV